MEHAETLMGRPYSYDGSLATGLTIWAGESMFKIDADSIRFIREQISQRSPVLMGANRDPLVRNSVGEALRLSTGKSPQYLSYVVPLLVEEGFCRASAKRPYMLEAIR